MKDPAQAQRDYYRKAATNYEEDHVAAGDEHFIALEYMSAIIRSLHGRSVLDVGSGSGRAVRFLSRALPDARILGMEPVPELRQEATRRGGEYIPGDGTAIPYDDDSFDFVTATGVMHHLPNPSSVVAEMARVAKCGVLISDSNRFGQGGGIAQSVKVLLYTIRLGRLSEFVSTRGRGFHESPGDGIFYSYSIFDSLPALSLWADRTFVIPTRGTSTGYLGSLTGSTHGLLVAVREPKHDWAGRELNRGGCGTCG